MYVVILFNFVALWLVLLLVLWLLLRLLKIQSMAVATREETGRDEQEPAPSEPLLGTPAPSFVAWTLDQRLVSHVEYQDHETLFIFLSTTCPHCRNVVPEIERVGEKLQRRGGKVALVFGESAEETRTYYERLELTLPVLVAPIKSTSFTRNYNRRGGVPAFVALNCSGIVTHEGVVSLRAETWRTFVREWQLYPLLSKDASLYR